MKIIQRRDVIRSVRDRYNAQYPDRSFKFSHGRTAGQTIDALAALNLETCTTEDVDGAIGNDSWASLRCDACGEEKAMIARFGEDPNHEARWQDLCETCLADALATLRRTTPTP